MNEAAELRGEIAELKTELARYKAALEAIVKYPKVVPTDSPNVRDLVSIAKAALRTNER